MGELGEFYRAWRDDKKAKQERYQTEQLPKDLALLESLDNLEIHEKHNDGQHWVLIVRVERGFREVDYYPSTGYWKVRNGRATGHRVTNLQKYFKLGVKA